MNITTGSMFLLTEPDQYILQPLVHFKLLFLATGGLNAMTFYIRALAARGGVEPGGRDAGVGADHRAVVALDVDGVGSWRAAC